MAKGTIKHLFGALLLAGLTLLLLMVTLVFAYNWTGQRAWEKRRSALEKQGEAVTMIALAPPLVPEDQNYAMTPSIASLFKIDPAKQKLLPPSRDTKTNVFPNSLAKIPFEQWRLGRHPRLGKYLGQLIEGKGETVIRANGIPITYMMDEQTAANAIMDFQKSYEPILTELQIASRRPHVRFNIAYDYGPPEKTPLPHLSFQNQATCLFALRAEALLAQGKTDLAFSNLLMAFRMADTLKNEPFLVSTSVHTTCLMRAIEPLWVGLNNQQWTEAQLKAIQELLHKENILEELRRGFRGDRAMTLATIEYYRNHSDTLLYIGDSPDLATLNALPETKESPGAIMARHIIGLLPSGWFYREMVGYNDIYTEKYLVDTMFTERRVNVEQIQRHMAEVRGMRSNIWQILKQHRHIASYMVQPLESVLIGCISTQTYIDLATIACGMERYRQKYGKYPDKPEALTTDFVESLPADLITGKPLMFRLLDDSQFVIYSIGWNAKDDGGKPGTTQGGRWTNTEGDWVWRCVPGLKEAKAYESN